MADSGSSRRVNQVTRPNTKSPHYISKSRILSVTCKVRACKVRKDLSTTGYCKSHTKTGISTQEMYETCTECSEAVETGQPGICCDKCLIWYHIECVGVSKKQYKHIVQDAKNEKPMFHWYCRICRDKCIEAVAKIDLLENQTRNLASKVGTLDDRVKEIEGKMGKKVTETIRSQLDERNDIDRRKMNIMIVNLAEPQINDADEQGQSWYNEKKRARERERAMLTLSYST